MDKQKVQAIEYNFLENESLNSSGYTSNGDWEVLEWANGRNVLQTDFLRSLDMDYTSPILGAQLEVPTAENNGGRNQDESYRDNRNIFNEIRKSQTLSQSPRASLYSDITAGTSSNTAIGTSRSHSGFNSDTSSLLSHHFLNETRTENLRAAPARGNPLQLMQNGSSKNKLVPAVCLKCASPTVNCLPCNEFMCSDCMLEHLKINKAHQIIYFPPPIGSPNKNSFNDRCELHNKNIAVVCNSCKKLICEDCFMENHRGHMVIPITNVTRTASARIVRVTEKVNDDIRLVKASIDDILKLKREMDHNFSEVREGIQKSFREMVLQIHGFERQLLEQSARLRNRRLACLDDQMAGLKSVLSGLWQTAAALNKISSYTSAENVDLASSVVEIERQLEQLETTYTDLHPKEEKIVFCPPDARLLNKFGFSGDVILQSIEGVPSDRYGLLNAFTNQLTLRNSEQILPSALTNSPPDISWSSNANYPSSSNSPASYNSDDPPRCRENLARSFSEESPTNNYGTLINYNYIPGSSQEVGIKRTEKVYSFGPEGQQPGFVSRAWGVCVDRSGRILVSDRRNNRVQVFERDGKFKFCFGGKGSGDGQFELPTGICVDVDDRIIVVDKDNHRVQIFSYAGSFLNKFGGLGTDPGKFQYPWDVAVSTRRQIVVADSRNHRIQQFDSEGRFIRKVVLTNDNPNKILPSPRGVCFTPEGHVIVTDFDNHCIYRINLEDSSILLTVGCEGSRINPIEFNRPSGVCCDDLGQIVVADSKNQRLVVLCSNLSYLWHLRVAPLSKSVTTTASGYNGLVHEKDRVCYVNLLSNGQVVFLTEPAPDCKEGVDRRRRFIHIL